MAFVAGPALVLGVGVAVALPAMVDVSGNGNSYTLYSHMRVPGGTTYTFDNGVAVVVPASTDSVFAVPPGTTIACLLSHPVHGLSLRLLQAQCRWASRFDQAIQDHRRWNARSISQVDEEGAVHRWWVREWQDCGCMYQGTEAMQGLPRMQWT